MKKLLAPVLILCALSGPVFADAGPAEPAEASEPAKVVVDAPSTGDAISGATNAFRNGHILVGIGFIFMIIVALLRGLLGFKIKWFKTKLGGIVLGFSTALLAALSVPFVDGQPFSWGLLAGALAFAWKGAGMHGHLKDFME